MEYILVPLIILVAVYLPEIKSRKETIKWQRQQMAELKEAIKQKDQEIAALRAEVKRKDEVIQRAADRLHQSVLKAKEQQSKLQHLDTD